MEESTSDSEVRRPEESVEWRQYFVDRDPALRLKLIGRYLPLARKIAAYLYGRRPDNSIDFADYLQYARTGLIECIDRFDPNMNVGFETFASYRIRGAVLNGIGHYTEKASQHAQRQSVLRERTESLREHDEEDDLFEDLADVAIGLALGYILEDSNLCGGEHIDQAADPYRSLELKRLRERIALIVEALPERERTIIRYHYFEHMEFNLVAEAFGLSKGRVSQLHARALKLLRDALRALDGFDKNV